LSRRKRCTDKHLDCGETVPGKEHPFTLTRMNNLAGVLSNQCKFEQTEEMHQQVLRLRETVPDRDHSDILTSINNLAMVLKDHGKYEQVEEMLRQVLRLSKTVLGKEYPQHTEEHGQPDRCAEGIRLKCCRQCQALQILDDQKVSAGASPFEIEEWSQSLSKSGDFDQASVMKRATVHRTTMNATI
jgi:Tetratricopeptide repeat